MSQSHASLWDMLSHFHCIQNTLNENIQRTSLRPEKNHHSVQQVNFFFIGCTFLDFYFSGETNDLKQNFLKFAVSLSEYANICTYVISNLTTGSLPSSCHVVLSG